MTDMRVRSLVLAVVVGALALGGCSDESAQGGPGAGDVDAATVRSNKTLFRIGTSLAEHETRFYRRDRLPPGTTFAGPAVILQADTTTLVPPGFGVRVDAAGNLILSDNG